ncbi:hemerythrin domain-containing protein [Nocardioides campestrisoli]|uniref:hemerythrin domain-containing protein n=1 Tax=Nocardioides campestrisoli TaxID=2736757 RepID=UPI00163D8E16|nr:hemerythrin domain-containing protein [Nocardioides campestrisoli]
MTGPQMSMNKVIQGAVRRDLDRFVSALAAFPAGDQRRADELQSAWENFDDQLHHHHTGEHEIAWPALQRVGVSAEVLAAMDAEHDTMALALTTAGEALGALVQTPDSARAADARAAFEQLRAVTVTHLDHEEAEIEPVYLANHDHPAVVEMSRQFSKDGGLAWGGRFLTWLLDGATPQERAAVDASVPRPVRTVLVGVFGRDYRRKVAPVWSR